MATAIIRPTAHIDYSLKDFGLVNAQNVYDGNEDTYTYSRRAVNGLALYKDFDMSAVPKNIAKITRLAVCVLYSSSGLTKGNMAYNSTSPATADMNDCGDGGVEFDLNSISNSQKKEIVVDFPSAVNYWNSHLNDFINGGVQFRLYSQSTTPRYYEVYILVEYEVSTITVTISASPAWGGTVTGGGTYESGSIVTATAMPNEGYVFSHWLINGENFGNSNPISGALTEDTAVTAVFSSAGASNVYSGTQKLSVYCGTHKTSVYCGTKKLT